QPPKLPAEHPRYRPDLLQQAHHAIAPQAALGLGATTEPLLTPDQEVMGEAGQEQHELLGFPGVLAAFDEAQALLVWAKRGLAQGAAIVGSGYGQGPQVGQRSHQGGLLRAALRFGRAHDPLASRATEPRGA